jgi:nickel-dependent lactate racemase
MYDRREFLIATGLGVTAPRLIGTALAAGQNLPDSVPLLKGSRKSVVIPTHEFLGDIEERLDFPAAWHIQEMRMAGHEAPELSAAEILQRLRRPIGARPLAELAAGKQNVVVTFDDLTRPTPTAAVLPRVVQELKAAGIAEEKICFLGSFGAHRTMEYTEVTRKLGPDLVRRHLWFNHNTFDNLTELGETSFKNRVYVNTLFLQADLRITLGGVKVHTIAGYGGGPKAVLPGVAGLSTIRHNHQVVARSNKTVGEAKVFKNEVRLDMVEAARMAKVDFGVQIVCNGRRRVCEVCAGDVDAAHLAACRAANRLHRTPMLPNADVLVANGYPQVAQATKALAWMNRSLREGGTGVLIMQHPEGMSAWHYLYKPGYSSQANALAAALAPRSSRGAKYRLIVYSQYLQRNLQHLFAPGTVFASTWEEVLRELALRHPADSRVAVYPCATLQHPALELDS